MAYEIQTEQQMHGKAIRRAHLERRLAAAIALRAKRTERATRLELARLGEC
jgi:hypothetical protein